MKLIIRKYNQEFFAVNAAPTIIRLIIRNNEGGGGGGVGSINISAGTESNNLTNLVFSNSNNISFGLSGSTITASFSNTGGAGGAAISAGGNSQNTGTIVFSNSNGISFGLSNNGVFTGSHNGLTSQSNQAFSAQGGSSAFQTLVFADTNGVSFSNSNGSVVATVRTDYQSTGNYLTTAMQSNASTQFVQANAVFNGTNATGTIASNGISISVNSQTADTNKAGTGFTSAGANISFSGTLDTNGLSLSASVAAAGGAQTAISGIRFSNTTYTSGTVSLSDGNGISWASTTGQAISITHALQFTSNTSAITSNALNTSASRVINIIAATNNTGGGTASLSSNVSFSNANGATFYTSAGGAIVMSYTVPTVTNSSFSVQDSATTINPVNRIAFSTGNNITLTLSTGASSVTVGVAHNLAGTSTGFTGGASISGSMTHNSSGLAISLSHPAWLTTADLSQNSSKYVQNWKLTGNTAGTTSSAQGTDLWFSGGNSITVSGSSNSIVFSVGAYLTTAMQSGASTQFVQANAGFNGTNASGTIASNSISVSVAAQTNQTIGGYATGNTGGQSSSSTFDARSFSVSAVGALTAGYSGGMLILSGATAAAAPVGISAGTTSGSLSNIVFSNSNLVSFGLNGSTITASVPATSSLSATGAQSISVNGSTISIGVPYITVTADNGSSQGSLSGLYFQNSNGLSFGISTSNNGSVSVTAIEQPNNFFEPYDFNLNASATSTDGVGTMNLMPFALQRGISFGQINVMASAAFPATSVPNTISLSNVNNSSLRFVSSYSFSNSNYVDVYLFSKLGGGSTSNLGTYASTRNTFGTYFNYTYDVSVNKTGGNSGSWSIKQTISASVTFPFVTSGTRTSGNAATTITTWGTGYSSWTSTASNSTSNTYATAAAPFTTSIASTFPATTAWSSYKMINLNFGTSISAGEWWIGINRQSTTSSSSSSANSNAAAGNSYSATVNASAITLSGQLNYLGMTNSISNSLGFLGGDTNSSVAPSPGHGSFSATYDPGTTYVNNAGQPNGAIAISNIRSNSNFFKTWIQFNSVRVGS